MHLFLRCAYYWGALIFGCIQYTFTSDLKGVIKGVVIICDRRVGIKLSAENWGGVSQISVEDITQTGGGSQNLAKYMY